MTHCHTFITYQHSTFFAVSKTQSVVYLSLRYIHVGFTRMRGVPSAVHHRLAQGMYEQFIETPRVDFTI